MNNYKECSNCNEVLVNNEYHNCTADNIHLNIPFATQIATQGISGLDNIQALISDPYRSDFNIYGVDKTKIIEKLEKKLAVSERSITSAYDSCEIKDEENSVLEIKNTRLENKGKKMMKERKNMEIEFKILKDVNRNLKNRLDNS